MKKFLSLALVAVLCLCSLAIPAVAENDVVEVLYLSSTILETPEGAFEQQLIDKFKRNPAIAQSLLQSGDGQRLMQMLTSQDGGAALNHAAQNAAAGNTKELATMLSNLMKSPEGMAIMNRINDSAKK